MTRMEQAGLSDAAYTADEMMTVSAARKRQAKAWIESHARSCSGVRAMIPFGR